MLSLPHAGTCLGDFDVDRAQDLGLPTISDEQSLEGPANVSCSVAAGEPSGKEPRKFQLGESYQVIPAPYIEG